MRKDAKTMKTADIARVQGYHEGGRWSNCEAYAFAGFKSNKYFTSDRAVKLDEHFCRADGKPLKGYGLEIETECHGITRERVLAEVFDKIIFPYFPADLFKMQDDGSLGGESSAECITQIMTREFIRNNYANFKLMYDTYFPAFGIACDSGNCGMHCNLSNALFGKTEAVQTEAIRKLYYIVNHHFSFCCALFYRNADRTMYCRRMNAEKDYARNLDLRNAPGGHGVSFNLDHFASGRVELRLVGGQKNYACFRNTMEAVFFLVDAVKRLSWAECDDLVKIFSGCNQYVFDRLRSYCLERRTITAAQVEAIRATVKREDLI